MPQPQSHMHNLLELERGTQRKKWKNRLPVALVFPNRYQLGMSNLGFQLVYHLLNNIPEIVCERFFVPDSGRPLSVESNRPLQDFPVIFCSVSFEQDYFNLVRLLAQGNISPLASERGVDDVVRPGQPLVIGGGVATFINPEPLAPFIDLFIVGEAEPVVAPLVMHLLDVLQQQGREELLLKVAQNFSGCYVPKFYTAEYGNGGVLNTMVACADVPERVQRIHLASCERVGSSKLFTPEAEFADMFLAELGRGCSRGCRFCAAGFVYRPPRLWSPESIIAAINQRPDEVSRIGLLGMEMADSQSLAQLSDYLLREGCALSFSSLRADVISEELCHLLQRSNLKSAAIAPDGGSERLRRVINKNITEQDVLLAAESLAKAGILNLKLYFMIGLPTEEMADLEELVALVKKVWNTTLAVGRSKGKMGNITLSLNSFVPKAWTPFQFHGMDSMPELKKKVKFLRKALSKQANVRLQVDQPQQAFYQAVLARGDRRVGEAFVGMLTDGYNWKQSLKEKGLKPEDYALRRRGKDELFPWEIIDHGIDRRYLWNEYQKGLAAKVTNKCDTAKCRRCGVCDD